MQRRRTLPVCAFGRREFTQVEVRWLSVIARRRSRPRAGSRWRGAFCSTWNIFSVVLLAVRDPVASIEEKRALLRWLGTQTTVEAMRMENYICLTSVMQRDGWVACGEGRWRKGERTLPMLAAAKASVSEQLAAETEAHLRKTVKNFKVG